MESDLNDQAGINKSKGLSTHRAKIAIMSSNGLLKGNLRAFPF